MTLRLLSEQKLDLRLQAFLNLSLPGPAYLKVGFLVNRFPDSLQLARLKSGRMRETFSEALLAGNYSTPGVIGEKSFL